LLGFPWHCRHHSDLTLTWQSQHRALIVFVAVSAFVPCLLCPCLSILLQIMCCYPVAALLLYHATVVLVLAFLPYHVRPCDSIHPLSCKTLCQHFSLIMPDPVSAFLPYHARPSVSIPPLSCQTLCQHFSLIMPDPVSAFLPFHARPCVSISP
jgi:hypothetical protein